ncbi:MAG: glutamine synthetase [Rickettsiales bacterium]|nr:glutamine synthetase [Rickettsiales bacterium]
MDWQKLKFWNRKPPLSAEDERKAVFAAYESACLNLDKAAEEAVELIDADIWNRYHCRLRLGFALDGVPAKNEDSAPEADELRRINRDYIEKEVRHKNKDELSVLDYEVSAFDYSFLEYTIQTGALLPKRAIAAAPKAKRVMQRIARDLGFEQFRFSPYELGHEASFEEKVSVSPQRVCVSLWRAIGGGDSGEHPSWHNITEDPLIRGHATGRDSLNVLAASMIWMAPRENSYSRYGDETPSSPQYFYCKDRDSVNGDSGHGVWAFMGKKAQNKRLENRLAGGDARPSLAALGTMLAVSAGLNGKITFPDAEEINPSGQEKLDAYEPDRAIPTNRGKVLKMFKAGPKNAAYAELERIAGKPRADAIFEATHAYIEALDKRDALVRAQAEAGEIEDVAYTDRMDRDAIIRHVEKLCHMRLQMIRDAEQLPHELEEEGEKPLLSDEEAAQFEKSLMQLQSFTNPYFTVCERVRTALWEVPEEEREDRYVLQQIGNVTAPLLSPLFDRLWDYLCDEEKLVSPQSRAFKMSDMSRIQTIAKYLTSFIMEQTLGDLLKEEYVPAIWGGTHSCLLHADMQEEARAHLAKFAADIMTAPRAEVWNMDRAHDALNQLYHSFYEMAGGMQNPKTPLEGITRFIAKLHAEAASFKGVILTDKADVQRRFGAELEFMGLTMSADDFASILGPHLIQLGYNAEVKAE